MIIDHITGGLTSKSLYTAILKAFQSLWMERGREKPFSPKDGCHYLLMSTQDWGCNGSEMLSHKSICGKPASFHMANIPSKQGIFVETQGTLAVVGLSRCVPRE